MIPMPTIILNKQNIQYSIRISKRSKRLRIVVYRDGSVEMVLPRKIRQKIIERFMRQKSDWILKKINQMKKRKMIELRDFSVEHYQNYKEIARSFVEQRVEEWNKGFGFEINKIRIKNQKTKWGSCSVKKNLNFNYRILFLPKEIQDYIIIHELCHLQEMNHSKKFWSLVENKIPNYKEIKNKL